MSQRTKRGLRVGATTLRILGAVGAAAVLVPALAIGSAQASPTGTARQAAVVTGVHVYDKTRFTGPDTWLNGNVGECKYVGAGWNDIINSARTESDRVVELWDNSGCTGGSIVVDRTGYGSIGNWVSAYRIR
ncbi:peptidase inhibitor family I36 protein [Streptosporangium sp. DT93]|uniref:peptidase inhibitor family I36 protein n=1 Tax=Streptosporangium sp. DT93 TaxID=3393428 RepID=UPI003CF3C2D7